MALQQQREQQVLGAGWLQWSLAACLLTILVGCGGGSGETAHLEGQVTIHGQALPADATGELTFQPVDGGKTVKAEIIDSKYDCPKSPTGEVIVKFFITSPSGPKRINQRTGEEYQEKANLVPAGSAPGVSITVTEDDPSLDFDLN
ncbi:hypothetical protein [Aeoliella mucimassa]|uniref:Uncharacterized protein n=1 Tax=Aeoliella mucimassa TaxID=2527972 RepID=A0A518AQV7_9BACT|nr:hypothetical protein [Aeoliella mucimassa]QDU57093.1 hypothetical protein Pan181_33070 [Aeoliella mucimassa]